MYLLWKALADFFSAKIPLGVLSFLGIIGIWGLMGAHFALAEGAVPGLHPGYCKQDEGCSVVVISLEELQVNFSGLQKADLRASMRENHHLLCGAQDAREQDRYQEYIDQDQEAYRAINNGEPYKLRMDCPS